MPAGVPRWLLLPVAVGALFVALPLLAMVVRVDWSAWPALVTSDASQAALWLSLRTASASTLACLVVGVPVALVLARCRFRGREALRSMVLLPLVMPPVVSGIALLYTFGRRGLLGQHLDAWGVHLAFATAAVVMAQAFVALPFLIISVEGALATAGDRYESVAATLGAAPTTVLRRVTLPLLLPSLVSGAVLAFARSLGEFGATIAFAGSLQGVTRTLPLEIYLRRETDPDVAIALALLLIVAAVAVITLGRRALGVR